MGSFHRCSSNVRASSSSRTDRPSALGAIARRIHARVQYGVCARPGYEIATDSSTLQAGDCRTVRVVAPPQAFTPWCYPPCDRASSGMMRVPTIQSARLELVSMAPAFLRASLEGRLDEAERLLGAALPPDWPGDRERTVRWRLDDLTVNPSAQPWLLRAIVLREPERRMIGHTGFHDPPGPEGKVEVGYSVLAGVPSAGVRSRSRRGVVRMGQPGARHPALRRLGRPVERAIPRLGQEDGLRPDWGPDGRVRWRGVGLRARSARRRSARASIRSLSLRLDASGVRV